MEGRWWLLAGVGVAALAKSWRPLTKAGIKGYLAARDGVLRLSEEARTGLGALVQEARSDYERMVLPPAGAAEAGTAPPRRRRQGTPTAA